MTDSKLTVRVPRELIENIKQYAALNHTTVTGLIEAYLSQIPPHATLQNAPIVLWLSGSLSQNVSIQDYRKYQDDKYAQ